MSSLSEVANQLRVQGDILGQQTNILEQIASSSQGTVKKMGFLEFMIERRKLKDLEAEREAGKPGLFSKMVDKISGSGTGSGGKGFDLKNFLPAGGLFGAGAALAAALPKFLLGRALPALLAKAFADQIANYVESQTGSKEIGDAIFRGLQTGAIGLLLGKKIGLISFLGGALFDEENRKKIDGILTKLRELSERFNIKFPTLEGILNSLTEMLGGSLDFVLAGLNQDAEGLSSNFGDFAKTVGLLALMISPFGTIARAIGLVKGGIKLALSAGAGLAGLVGMAGTGAFAKYTTSKEFKEANRRDLEELSKDKKKMKSLKKEGFRIEDGKLFNKAGLEVKDQKTVRSILSNKGFDLTDDLNKKVNPKIADRYRTLARVAGKLPGIGLLISGGLLASVLMSDDPFDEKVKAIGNLFGGLAGAAAFGALGFMAGGPAGAIAAALVGGTFGSEMGEAVATWLMTGKTPSLGSYQQDPNTMIDPDTDMMQYPGQRKFSDVFNTPIPNTYSGLDIDDGAASIFPMRMGSGGVNVIDTSTTNIGSTQTHYGGVVNSAGIHDFVYG